MFDYFHIFDTSKWRIAKRKPLNIRKVLSKATLHHLCLLFLLKAFLHVGLFVLLDCWEDGKNSSWLIMFFFEFVFFLIQQFSIYIKGCPAAIESFIYVCLEIVSYKAKPICFIRLYFSLKNKPELFFSTTIDEYSRIDFLIVSPKNN